MRSKLAIIIAALGLMLVPGSAFATGTDPCPAFNLNHTAQPDPSCDAVPHFKSSFINRVWSFQGSVDNVDLSAHNLDMTTSGIENLPARFASQDDPILDQDTHVLFKADTKVFGPEGTAVTQDHLDYADDVVVRGKLLPPSKWYVNEDGVRVPTIRAKRMYIASYTDGSSSGYDSADPTPSTDPAPVVDPPADPTPADGRITTIDVEVWIKLHIQIQR
jgi:hypothetical protein